MNRTTVLRCCFVFALLTILAACARPKYLKEGQFLLTGHTIAFEKQAYKLQEDQDLIYYELDPTVKQKPNLKVLGLRPLLFFYRVFREAKKEQRIRYWFKTKVGEPPTILDTVACERSARSMRYQLNHKGYYKAESWYSVKYKRHKAYVTYHVRTNEPTLIDSVFFHSPDSSIQAIMERERAGSLLKTGQPLTQTLFEKEKARITIAIRNAGYEKFSWNFMTFEADTVRANNPKTYEPQPKRFLQPLEQGEPRARIYVNVLPYSDTMLQHPVFTVRHVWVNPEDAVLLPHQKRTIKKDSTFVAISRDTALKYSPKRYYASESEIPATDSLLFVLLRTKGTKAVVRDAVLAEAVQVGVGGLYSFEQTKQTVQAITDLDVFKFPRLEYVRAEDGSSTDLDCVLKMRPANKNVFSMDVEVNSYNANLGSALNFSYRNRNIFRGAEVFALKLELGGAFRTTQDSTLGADATWLDNVVSLLDINAESSLYFPRLLAPRRWVQRTLGGTTRFSIGYRFLRQGTDLKSVSSVYARFFSYDWRSRANSHHHFALNPLSLNITFEPGLSEAFEEKLQQSNPALLASLKDKFVIPSLDFTYTFTTPERIASNSWFIKLYGETAGNVLNLLDRVVAPTQPFRFFGDIDYSQYVKADVDLRYSVYINRRQSFVVRMLAGAALPYSNAEDRGVPFSRRFFLGGPNSMRAWGLRQIGPGRIKGDPAAAFQLGDIRLELNAEYRFKFNSWIAGAIFVDAGNVWLWRPANETTITPPAAPQPDGVIRADFLSELAVGTGFGLRLDFSFFVLRFDYGIQLYNPAGYGLMPDGSTRYWNIPPTLNWDLRPPYGLTRPFTHSNFVLGIGYPF